MQIWIQQTDGAAGPLFCVSNGVQQTKPVSLPDPATYPVEGYADKRLLPELAWYLEKYLEFPAGAEAKQAEAVVKTLKQWGQDVFDALFVQHAYTWYANARRNLDALEIKIVSNSPAVLSWPWEALCGGDDGYLAQHCCMERQPPALDIPSREAPEGNGELHILFIVSRPDTENKVGYHGLEREIIRYIRDKNLAVTVDVLRPPTFENLRRVLRERPGYYHIVHFDGHGGYGPIQQGAGGSVEQAPEQGEQDSAKAEERIVVSVPAIVGGLAKYQGMEGQLVFETDVPGEEVGAEAVGAEKLGQLLSQCGVSMMVLNACQSAKITDQAGDPFASVAARLLKAGIPSVTAMGYSLYLSGAKQFVPAFYDALFHGGGPAGAIRAGRQAMYAHPERPCFYGECPLQDWIVPELYQQVSAGARILPAVGKLRGVRKDLFPKDMRRIGDYGLIGRGREIHDLERVLQRNRQAGILIHGMAGTGKTTLAKGFLHWLRDTSGLREDDGTDCPVFWFDFQGIQSAEAVINRLTDAFLDETARTLDTEDKLDALAAVLRTRRAYLIWDNFESASGIAGTEVTAFLSEADRNILKQLLRELRGGRTRVFITSRTKEEWLSVQECARLETLGGLEGDERWDYCRELVRDLGISIDRKDKDLKALLDKLGGNPLALRVILLRLGEGKKAAYLLEELDTEFTGAAGDAGTEQMLKAFRVLSSDIDPALIPVLQVIGLHEHFADADWVASILWNMDESTDPDSPEAQSLRNCVRRCFQILENAGLCTDESDNIGGNAYRLHPALRGCLARMYPPPEDVRRWFVRYLAYVEDEVNDDIKERVALSSFHGANFLHAKTLAEELDMREEELSLRFGLAIYADDISRTALAEKRFRELAEKAHQYGDFDKEYRAYGMLSNLAKGPESARAWTQKAADMWSGAEKLSADAYYTLGYNAQRQDNLSAAVENYKRALAILEQENDTRVVPLYGILGDLAQQQGDMEGSKAWYQKSWEKAKELDEVDSQADASRDLGRIAAEQGDAAEALERYQEALNIFTALQNPEMIAATLNDIGQLLNDIGAYAPAKEYLMESVRIAESIGNEQLAAHNYNALGLLSENQGDFTSAKLCFAKALSMWENLHDAENAAITRRNLERATALEANGG